MKMQERRGRGIMSLSIHSDDLTLSLIIHVMCLFFLLRYVTASNRMNVVSVNRFGTVFSLAILCANTSLYMAYLVGTWGMKHSGSNSPQL